MSTAISTSSISTKPAGHLPGEVGIWIFIFAKSMVFSLLFSIFMYYRSQELALFQESQAHLSQFFGALNTFFMLTSSWFAAMAVHAYRRKLGKVTPILFMLAFICGVGFIADKFFEYGDKIQHGFTINSNQFFMYYYMLTGIHFFHVLIGMSILAFMTHYTWSGEINARKISLVECGVSFWHLVDLLWIVLFALLYLIK